MFVFIYGNLTLIKLNNVETFQHYHVFVSQYERGFVGHIKFYINLTLEVRVNLKINKLI